MNLESINLVDALLVLVLFAGIWVGWRQGFLAGAAQLAALVASLAIAFIGYQIPVRWLTAQGLDAWAMPLAFLGIFVLARAILGMLFRAALSAVPARVHAHGSNRALGVFPGAVQGLVNASIVAALLLVLPLADTFSRTAQSSALAERMARPVMWVEARLMPIFAPAVQATLGRLIVRRGSDETVALPFRVAQPRARPDLEARMLELVNAERVAAGLGPLRADPELVEVARLHSADMFARGYFSHITPEGRGPFDRMRAKNVRFLAAGENLALARSLQLAHDGLMDSPGHRANILRPAFGRLGVGVLDGGVRGLMVTQNFRN
jgi:uncharacterized protein YkwD